jgi:hypothetical protein
VQHRHLLDPPVVAVDGRSSRAWMQAADVVVRQHRSRWAARRWANAIRSRYPGCTLAVSRHQTGLWWLVGDADVDIVITTVHSSHGRDLPSVEVVGRIAFHVWVLWQAGLAVGRERQWSGS